MPPLSSKRAGAAACVSLRVERHRVHDRRKVARNRMTGGDGEGETIGTGRRVAH